MADTPNVSTGFGPVLDESQVGSILETITGDLEPSAEPVENQVDTQATPTEEQPEAEQPQVAAEPIVQDEVQQESVTQEATEDATTQEPVEGEVPTKVNPMKELRKLHNEDSRTIRQQAERIAELEKAKTSDKPEYSLEETFAAFVKAKSGELEDVSLDLVRQEIHKHTPDEVDKVIVTAGRGGYGDLSEDILSAANQYRSSVKIAHKEREQRNTEFATLSDRTNAFNKVRAASLQKVEAEIPDLDQLQSEDAKLFAETTLELRELDSNFVDNSPVSPEIILAATNEKKYKQLAARLEAENKELKRQNSLISSPQSGSLSSSDSTFTQGETNTDADQELLSTFSSLGF